MKFKKDLRTKNYSSFEQLGYVWTSWIKEHLCSLGPSYHTLLERNLSTWEDRFSFRTGGQGTSNRCIQHVNWTQRLSGLFERWKKTCLFLSMHHAADKSRTALEASNEEMDALCCGVHQCILVYTLVTSVNLQPRHGLFTYSAASPTPHGTEKNKKNKRIHVRLMMIKMQIFPDRSHSPIRTVLHFHVRFKTITTPILDATTSTQDSLLLVQSSCYKHFHWYSYLPHLENMSSLKKNKIHKQRCNKSVTYHEHTHRGPIHIRLISIRSATVLAHSVTKS